MFLRFLVSLHVLLATAAELPIQLRTERLITSGLANVHVTCNGDVHGEVRYTYGACNDLAPHDDHQIIAITAEDSHDRLVWKVPEARQSGGCVSAWDSSSSLVGRSHPVVFGRRKVKRTVVPMDNSSNIDSEGPWFDGVEHLSGTSSTVDTAAAKSKEVVVVGAGMAGIMTWLVLHQAGMRNLHVVEASQRLGGRIRTQYFGEPSLRLYQEMGPMRFPKSITNMTTNETLEIQDHKLVFDLAAEINRINGNNANLSVNFIKWLQRSQGGLQCAGGVRKPDGRCPTLADIAKNSSLKAPDNLSPEAQNLTSVINSISSDPLASVATNVFEAHKQWLDSGLGGLGGDQWSEFAYVHNYLHYSLNATDQVLGADALSTPFWDALYDTPYFSATDWVTIDGGLEKLPLAFRPQMDNVTSYGRKVSKISYDEDTKKVSISWRPSSDFRTPFQNASYDYAITTVPLALLRLWDLPEFSVTKTDAIQKYGYDAVCKVALLFKTRFWEHFDQPIIGGCSTTTDIPGIGSICYPSYDINSTGPGVMLASYTSADSGQRWISYSADEHVQYVVNAMADIHGDVVHEQYTGEYKRQCWLLDEFENVSWAAALVGQRQLYLPAFFTTEKGVILSGEGTSYTAAWISSALESGIRAGVQLMLELGLVDEANSTVDKWMARWISI